MQRTRTDAPREPRRQGRPPKGEDDADALAETYASLYLREWKAKGLDVQLLYRSTQLRTARERYYGGEPDGTDKAVLLLRRWCALYCGERAIQNALALGRGNELRVARVAARILEYRLYHPDLTRQEEAEIVGKELDGSPTLGRCNARIRPAVRTHASSRPRMDSIRDLATLRNAIWCPASASVTEAR